VVASYEKVTTRLEDAGLKNLAADIDWHAHEIKMSAEKAEHTFRFFRDRRELREKAAAVMAGPHCGPEKVHGEAAGKTDASGAPLPEGPVPAGPLPAGMVTEDADQVARERLRKSMDLHRKRASRTNLN
jgi:hypothetical protein